MMIKVYSLIKGILGSLGIVVKVTLILKLLTPRACVRACMVGGVGPRLGRGG